jgi:energy-coupling factor transport system permease protein
MFARRAELGRCFVAPPQVADMADGLAGAGYPSDAITIDQLVGALQPALAAACARSRAMAAIRISYYAGNQSFVSRLDARTKLLYIGWVFVMIVVFSHPLYQAFTLATLLAAVALGRLSAWAVIKAGRFGIYVGLASWLLWIVFLRDQGAPLLWLGPLVVTDQGALVGLAVAMRITLVLFAFLVVAMTTPNRELIAGLQGLRVPLVFAMAIGIVLRLIPQFQAEHASIVEAQQSRATEFERGGLFQRLRKRTAYVIPLSLRALKIASDLSVAMDSRAFDPYAPRTVMRAARRTRADRFILGLLGAAAVAGVLLRLLGYGGVAGGMGLGQ